ncbi:ice-binding family protein [Nonomuraea sp. NPDC049695]|uniref:ice-binding family protein n=1 Tax=Nonomuraea sp. NPDC049695 TaxID=3154734 RepID=UPI003446A1E0
MADLPPRTWASMALAGVLLMAVLGVPSHDATARQGLVDFGDAWDTAVVAGAAVNSADLTRITGDVVVSPGIIVTGFPPGKVVGTIHRDDAEARATKADAVAAYSEAAGRTPTEVVPSRLGGKTFGPGVYKSVDGTFLLSGTLTLDGQGDPDAVFIFQADSTLNAARVSNIDLMNGAQENNIVWQIGDTATVETYATFRGNILAKNAVMVQDGAVIYGRVAGLNTTVTIDGTSTLPATTITVPSIPGTTPARSGTGAKAGKRGEGEAAHSKALVTVYRPPTTTTLTSSPNPSRLHEPVTFTAVVHGDYNGSRPTGSVLFKDGATQIGSVLTGDQGVAKFTTSELTRGVHYITAVYVDDGTGSYEAWVYFTPSESPALEHQVLNRR